MTVFEFFSLIFLLSIINACFTYTQWFRKIFLFSNIIVFLASLSFWIFYNKMYIGLQFCSRVTLNVFGLEWGLLFGLNSLSLFFLILTTFLTCICLFINFEKKYKPVEFNFLMWVLQIILIVFFTTSDLIVFFICFELTLVPIFLIILTWGSSIRRAIASYYFFIYTSVGAVLMIIGICLIVFECGNTNFLVLEQHKFAPWKQNIYFFLFFWGFAIKIPIFPFHLWLPEAHVEAPSEGSVLLAGLLLKLGGYGLIKVCLNFFPAACKYYVPMVCAMCLVSIIMSSFNAIVQADFKKLIAYTSISHMNFVVLGIFSHNIFGLAGAVLLMYAHGIVSSGLFASVGLLYERYSSRQMEYFGGLVIGMPLFSTFFFIILLGNFAFPLTFNFVGEFLVLIGLAHFNLYILFLSSIGMFLAVVYSILLYNKLMFGNLKGFVRKIKDVTLFEFNYLFSLSLASIFFGICPMPILDSLYLTLLFCLLK